MEPAVIRSARDDDIDRMVELLEHGSLVEGREDPDDRPAYRSALAEIQSTPGCDVLVAETDGVVVGMCQVMVFRHLNTTEAGVPKSNRSMSIPMSAPAGSVASYSPPPS